ncbi:MAG: hypothetical protein WBF99_12435 [Xanthobacteraceae bacterium]
MAGHKPRKYQTPEERAMYAERAKERDRLKSARKRAKKRAAKQVEFKQPISKTSPEYRKIRFPKFDEGSKSELRSILTQAVLNTGGWL